MSLVADLITRETLSEYYEGVFPTDDATNRRLDRLIALAAARLRARVPSIDRRLADGTLDPVLVEGALAGIILRTIRNPRGVIQEQAGEFSYRLAQATEAGSIVIYDDDIADLLPPTGGIGVAIGTVRVGMPGWGAP